VTPDTLGRDPFAGLGQRPDRKSKARKKARKKTAKKAAKKTTAKTSRTAARKTARKTTAKMSKPAAKKRAKKTITSAKASRPKARRRARTKQSLGLARAPAAAATSRKAKKPARPAPPLAAPLQPASPAARLEERLAERSANLAPAAAPRPAAAPAAPLNPPPPYQPAITRLGGVARRMGRLLYDRYFRVQADGAEHLPPAGPVVLVANHAGLLPLDVLMLQVALEKLRSGPRPSRWVASEPSLPIRILIELAGGARTAGPGADELRAALAAGEAALLFPEGAAARGKPYDQRYRLRPFGSPELFRPALDFGATVIPVALVGGEETQPVLFRVPSLLGGLPATPALLPLPVKWRVRFGAPVPAEEVQGASPEERAASLQFAARRHLTGLLADLLAERRSLFF